jgi:hypothetical protein
MHRHCLLAHPKGDLLAYRNAASWGGDYEIRATWLYPGLAVEVRWGIGF